MKFATRIIMLLFVLCTAQARSIGEVLKLDMRIIVESESQYIFSCRAKNDSDTAVNVDIFMTNANIIKYTKLTSGTHFTGTFGRQVRYLRGEVKYENIESEDTKEWKMPKSMLLSVRNNILNHYIKLTWYLAGRNSQGLFFGLFGDGGDLFCPSTNHRESKYFCLAFIFNEKQPHEIGFLLMNGSDKAITIEKPLTQTSCIVATAPAIGYTNELHIAGQAPECIAIEPGKVGEWRIPWPTIHDLIPADDLAAIKAAGGDLDLVWRAGAYQSDPLPLSLAPPAAAEGAAGGDEQQ